MIRLLLIVMMLLLLTSSKQAFIFLVQYNAMLVKQARKERAGGRGEEGKQQVLLRPKKDVMTNKYC